MNDLRNLRGLDRGGEEAPASTPKARSATPPARCTTSPISSSWPRGWPRWAATPSRSRTWPACSRPTPPSNWSSAHPRSHRPADPYPQPRHLRSGRHGAPEGGGGRRRHHRHLRRRVCRRRQPSHHAEPGRRARRAPTTTPACRCRCCEEISAYFKEVRKKYWQFESDLHRRRHPRADQPGAGRDDLQPGQPAQGTGRTRHAWTQCCDEIPRVRQDLGYPPLVTPTSQIVGTQAVLNVLTGERYKSRHQRSEALPAGPLRQGAGARSTRKSASWPSAISRS